VTDSIFERFGGTVFPADVGTDLQATSLDPAREVLTGLFRQAFISEFGSAWTQVTAALGTPWSGTTPVEDTLEIRPNAQILTERKGKLPLLCVYRKGTPTFDEHTLAREKMIQEWGVVWIIGQADTAAQRKLYDFLQAAVKLVRLVLERRGHPDYQGGDLQLFEDTAGLGRARLTGASFEPVALNEKDPTEWLILDMTIETEEYSYLNLDQFGEVDYATVEMGVGDSTGTIPGLINIDTRYPVG
jgi:hypothetical protein